MFDTRIPIPDFFKSITFDNGVVVEFNEESNIRFYNDVEDEAIMCLDPSDLSTLYASYRNMVKEQIEERHWSGK